jgi:YgiT-type zinc finger domain-containing protein
MNLIKIYGHLILKTKTDNMECVICKSGIMHEGKVTVTLEKNGSIILIKEVPAQVCDVCEHYYLDEQTTGEVLKRGTEGLLKGADYHSAVPFSF